MSIAERDGEEPYQIFERLDEDQIAEEIQGVYAKTLVYQFEGRDGRMVTGLSIKGVYEVAKSLVRHGYDIAVEEARIIEETDSEYKASCKATFKTPNGHTLTTYGYSKSSKFYGKTPSEFAYVQALSKAQRNALRTLIPEKFAAKCIEEFLAERRGDQVKRIPQGLKTEFMSPIQPKPVESASVEQLSPPADVPTKEMSLVESAGLTLPTQRRVTVRFLKDVAPFTGIDLKPYGAFKAEDVGSIPEMDASDLVKTGVVQLIEVGKPAIPAEQKAVRQDLVGNDQKVYGSIELAEGEVTVLFTPPIPNDPSTVGSFLCERILDGAVAKAKTENRFIDYQLDDDEAVVRSIHIIGDVTEKMMKDLVSPCTWTAKTATGKKL